MLKQIFVFTMIASALAACNTQMAKTNATTATNKEVKGQNFGSNITADGAVNYTDLLTQIQGKDSVEAKVVGTVDAVCQMKGCWMNIAAEKAGQPEMMVQFKDYGFFVPKNIAGRKVIMQGFAYRSVTPVDELRHYAEDAGKTKEEIEKITQPKEELKFLASGVLLVDEQSGK